MNTKYYYVCESWQGLLQQVVYLISRGYLYWHVTYFPQNKDNVEGVDHKLIDLYKTNKSKFQRSRLKNKGIANFYYLRWQNVIVILHTPGELEEGVIIQDRFTDIKEHAMNLQISDNISFRIQFVKNKVTVRLSNKTYSDFEQEFKAIATTKNKWLMIQTFDKINGFPAFSGIVNQKVRLAKYLVNQAKKHNTQLIYKELRIMTKRRIVKVWTDSNKS